ncbi:MAG: hypothetical protein ACD_28C00300G0004 [uncultured bacterium]|nr:MAG: hypothetical protein ACD_28C00300G0004 [uncultured bacterium]KKT76739.1 MAG: hypothetical protein UW70_C0014G0005 [Candidatus Peregrinibacteria bacterium GW2011_GWA2_44_7]
MKQAFKNSVSAFTLIEVVLVVTLVGILFGFSILYTQTAQMRADLTAQTRTAVAYLRMSQSEAMAGRNGRVHGIHFENDSYTLFEGDLYAEGSPGNRIIELPSTLSIGNINFQGGQSDVIFFAPDGTTETYGSFTLNSDKIQQFRTITIRHSGIVTY